MMLLHCLFLVLSILTIKGINCQYYSQLNNRFYGNYKGNFNRNLNGYKTNYNNIYNSNYNPYNDNVDRNLVRYQEAAVRPGELTVEVNEAQGPTPCRNKEASKEHKETLWWTLPIPPMELEGPPEKPPQIKQEQSMTVEKGPPASGGGVETGAMQQQKHAQPAQPAGPAATTPKAQPAAPTQAVAQVATTMAAKHEATTQAAKTDKQKIAQMQKQQQASGAAAGASANQGQQQQPQQSAPAPTQLVVSNKESNNLQMIANKSVATMKAPNTGRNMAPIMQHGANKQKVMLNRMEPAAYQYGDTMGVPQSYVNYPYYNPPQTYLREPQLAPNRNYRADMLQDTIAELADNMYKEFDSNDAEIGGGAVVGENSEFSRQGQQNLMQYDNNLAQIQHQDAIDQWNLPEDERNKRNLLKNTPVIS